MKELREVLEPGQWAFQLPCSRVPSDVSPSSFQSMVTIFGACFSPAQGVQCAKDDEVTVAKDAGGVGGTGGTMDAEGVESTKGIAGTREAECL